VDAEVAVDGALLTTGSTEHLELLCEKLLARLPAYGVKKNAVARDRTRSPRIHQRFYRDKRSHSWRVAPLPSPVGRATTITIFGPRWHAFCGDG
jgi:hypothetical protein